MRLTENQLRAIIRRAVYASINEAPEKKKGATGGKGGQIDKNAASTVENELDISTGPSAVLKFLNGPGADPRVRSVLALGNRDGEDSDDAATPSVTSKRIGDLVPTQVEIELTKSIGYPLAKYDSMKKMISGGVQKIGPKGNDHIVVNGNLIVDGHHRWSSLFSMAGPDGEIAAIDLGLPVDDAASVLAATQVAIASTLKSGEKVPEAKAGGMNILGKGKDAIKSLIEGAVGGKGEAGSLLTDDYVQKCIDDASVSEYFEIPEDADVESARAAIIEKVSDNLSQMNQPASGAPPRVDMPQMDKAGGGQRGVVNAFAKGKVNFNPPFAPESGETKKESRARGNNDQVVLERWQKLAGIIKG